MSVAIALGTCVGCGACIPTCHAHALLPAPGRPQLIASRCDDCGACVEVCPTGAIVGSWERR